MLVRLAENKDIPTICSLLRQVHLVHSSGRPDIFRKGSQKYNEEELVEIINNENTPVFVADDGEKIVGYAFTQKEITEGDESLADRRVLYLDDLCVDENIRGQKIGTILYNYVVDFAKKNAFDSITLNVWELNEGAKIFYHKLGLLPLKTTLEQKLK